MILVVDQKEKRNCPLGKAFNHHIRIELEISCQDEIVSQQRYSVAFLPQLHPLVGDIPHICHFFYTGKIFEE